MAEIAVAPHAADRQAELKADRQADLKVDHHKADLKVGLYQVLDQALEARKLSGGAGGQVAHVLASGDGWRVADVVCTSGPHDHPFEEQHSEYSIAVVLAGTFQYRSPAGHALMTPGAAMLGTPGQCFECGHDHGAGDRCVAFWYSRDRLERLVSDSGHRGPLRFDLARIPPVRALAPVIAAAAAHVVDPADAPWDEIGTSLAARVATLVRGSTPLYRSPLNSEARVTRIVRAINRVPAAPFTVDALAGEAGLSPYHFLRTFERLTGVTPHQYVLRARLREAAIRLVSRNEKILDVALACGFGDVSNFNRTFRAEFGVAPGDYRRGAGLVRPARRG